MEIKWSSQKVEEFRNLLDNTSPPSHRQRESEGVNTSDIVITILKGKNSQVTK